MVNFYEREYKIVINDMVVYSKYSIVLQHDKDVTNNKVDYTKENMDGFIELAKKFFSYDYTLFKKRGYFYSSLVKSLDYPVDRIYWDEIETAYIDWQEKLCKAPKVGQLKQQPVDLVIEYFKERGINVIFAMDM